ncbi:unnamed protein product [Spirodela intermedia]|uniref:Uncharacterized protein n=1 Tax=Spirodela intermedia TaxID=51605 RepID=A0A7I8ISX0_SPIIN|nr:unnamed protein product [Spirodela intermedia]CAA6661111.1 unnamed protein product [Spirodela intermedia]
MLIENFIWDLQRYINSNTTSEEEKVFVRSLFLAGHAKTYLFENIREYVEKFSMLILEVPRMDEEDKLHYFMERLQTLAQNEICRQGVHDI